MSNRYASRSYRPAPRFRRPDMFPIFMGAMCVLVVGLMGFGAFQAVAVKNSHISCTVVDKDRTKDSDGASDMRIYTENCDGGDKNQVFKVGDNWFAGQFDSANTYSEIEIGESYDFETRGTRIPIISMFENIVGVSEASK